MLRHDYECTLTRERYRYQCDATMDGLDWQG